MTTASRAAGFDAARLEAVVQGLQARVDARRLPGAVVHVERHGVVALSQSIGWRDPALSVPMRADAIFRIYSMTKPIVSVAAMRLFEQGRLRLDDPVSRFIPEFGATQVLVEAGAAQTLVAARQAITVQDLLRHTAGLTYEFLPPSAARRLYVERDLYSRKRSNREHAAAIASLPLQHQPGSAWEYSRATDVLGRVVEVVGGRALGAHLREALFEPLGMADTGFHVPPGQHDRLAEGFPLDPDTGQASMLADVRAPAALESGGGGLVSTTADYVRFIRMLLRGGELDGVRVLGRKTVEFMISDHLGAIPVASDVLPPGHGFGLGFAVRLATGIAVVPGSAGTYGWGGAMGTLFFVDPHEQLFAILMIQAARSQREEFQQLFRNMVYAAIDG
jgi:CubicO group peptidase (beta-lactamase class C family)